MQDTTKLPSQFQPGQLANLNFFEGRVIENVRVVEVKFTEWGKVNYDIAIPVKTAIGMEEDELVDTIIKDVDSIFVEAIAPLTKAN